MNIYEKLLHIQNELKAPKSNRNTFGNYNYRSCEDILESVKPIVLKYNTAIYLFDSIEHVGERYYIKATVTLIDNEKQLETISVSAYAREEETKKGMDSSQITGAASSYARKYALNGLFCIDDTKDADATNTHGKDTNVKTEKELEKIAEHINEGQAKRVYAMAHGNKELLKKICGKYGYLDSRSILVKDYEKICKEVKTEVLKEYADPIGVPFDE